MMSRFPLGIACFFCCAASVFADEPGLEYNRDIRPILSENCFYCHGQDANKRMGDLRLDQRDAALAAKAIVPGDPTASGLVERIFSDDPETMMPPPKSNRKLSPEQKEKIKRWIAAGANYQNHWAFVAPQRPAAPDVKNADWVRTPIDRFILAKLESEGLPPTAEADRATLIRRLSADLTGLPPSPAEVDEFVNDPQPLAYERLVERMLSSPNYGERMALPWLDAARYADSNGFQQDGDTWQWMWRDWVVAALNRDLPFDDFTVWQLAGDLLPDATVEQKIASGFNRNHLLNGEGGAIPEEQRWVILFDRIDTTSTNWLGLTMACAQCHDHKYDPMTMRDYYSLLDAFNRLPESGTPQYFSPRIRVGNPVLELPTDENKARIAEIEAEINENAKVAGPLIDAAYHGWRAGVFADNKPAEGKGLPEPLNVILRKPEGERNDDEKKQLETGLRKHFDEKVRDKLGEKIPEIARYVAGYQKLSQYKNDQIPRPMIMSDAQPRKTHILSRGEYLQPAEPVSFATPAFLPAMKEDAPQNRLGFARWLVSPEQPLMSRVIVNRMWQHFFGMGLVKTAEDFGVQSEYPIHGALLDWLAVEFRENGWSQKEMHRLIVTSNAYRQSGKVSAEHLQRDPANRLFGRASRFRMSSLILRDWALASAGMLDRRIGGKPVYPYQPDGVWESLAITKERDFTYPQSSGADLYRRSLYTFWRRTVGPANMFDAANRQACRVRNMVNNTPLHALTTLNDPTWVEAARGLAEQSLKTTSERDGQLAFAWRRVLGRPPAEKELTLLRRMHDRQLAAYQAEPAAAAQVLKVGGSPRDESLDPVQHAALTSVCLGVLNIDKALTRE